MCMANWSDLPYDTLQHLTSFLPIQDYLRFGAVCRNWRIVAKQKCHSPAQQIPWLALGEMEDTKKRKFYNLLEDRHYYLDVPELRGKAFCGSSYGWLFTLDRKLNFHLVNPLTKECYDLPPPPIPSDYSNRHEEIRRYFEAESDDEDAHGHTRELFERLKRCMVPKAILDYDPSKRSDFTVVILEAQKGTPAFWKPGSNAWTAITGVPHLLDDITFFEGKFYAVRGRLDNNYLANNYSVIYTFDVGSNHEATKVELEVLHARDPNYVAGYRSNSFSYLVVFDNELLLVERIISLDDITRDFFVHKLDLGGNNYSKCQDINKHTIFMGVSSAVVISPSQFFNCMKDAIYFTDNSYSYGALNLGFYDFKENKITYYISTSCRLPPYTSCSNLVYP
ncbi:F-box family protein [Rhynchospora pubera]|uniref:F-box family protein n=1 Tax=Rhynchospora pubera TaxID=906938 RepID=A0AAV8EG17_9POAL|nr:F-box family protein [Rhynchospora pubera]